MIDVQTIAVFLPTYGTSAPLHHDQVFEVRERQAVLATEMLVPVAPTRLGPSCLPSLRSISRYFSELRLFHS